MGDVASGSKIGNVWWFDVSSGNIEFGRIGVSEIDVGVHDLDAGCLNANVSDGV